MYPLRGAKCDFAASRLKTYVVQKWRLDTHLIAFEKRFQMCVRSPFLHNICCLTGGLKIAFLQKFSKMDPNLDLQKVAKMCSKSARNDVWGVFRPFYGILAHFNFWKFWKNFAGQSRKNRQNGQNLKFGFSRFQFKLFEQFFFNSASRAGSLTYGSNRLSIAHFIFYLGPKVGFYIPTFFWSVRKRFLECGILRSNYWS